MTSVQDYLRELRAARKEFMAGDKAGARGGSEPMRSAASPAIGRAVSSPWLKQPAPSEAPRPPAGQKAAASSGQGAVRPAAPQASSSPSAGDAGRPAAAGRRTPASRGAGRPPVGRQPPLDDVDSDSDISRLLEQMSLKSTPKPAAATAKAAATAATAAVPPRRGSKMDMLRRKFSASSPTKSWADLGSSGGSLSRGRTRSAVSILDEKIILSGISGDEEESAPDSASEASSSGTSSSGSIRTESAAPSRQEPPSSAEVPEELEPSRADSSAPEVPSASSVQSQRHRAGSGSGSGSGSGTVTAGSGGSGTVTASSVRSRLRPAGSGRAEARGGGARRMSEELSARAQSSRDPSPPTAASSGTAEPPAADRRRKESERTVPRTPRPHRTSDQNREPHRTSDPATGAKRRPEGSKRSSREQRAKHSSRSGDGKTNARHASHAHHRRKSRAGAEPAEASRPRPAGGRVRRRRGASEQSESRRDLQDRTDASESLVVSYQRRVAYSSGGRCRQCRRQAWGPPAPVTVVVPPAVGRLAAVELGAAAASAAVVDADDDPVIVALLTQQIALTRHFLATQRRLHGSYRRLLRRADGQVCTDETDLQGSGRARSP